MQSPYDPIAEEDADHPIQRDLWFYRGRVIPGESTAALRYRAHLQKMQIRSARIAAAETSLRGAGADAVIETVAQLIAVLESAAKRCV